MMNPASASFRHRERGGITIMVVLMLLVLLTIAAVSMSKNAVREVIIAGTSRQGAEVRSLADSGLEWSLYWMEPADPAGNRPAATDLALTLREKIAEISADTALTGQPQNLNGELALGTDRTARLQLMFMGKVDPLGSSPDPTVSPGLPSPTNLDCWSIRAEGRLAYPDGPTFLHRREVWLTALPVGAMGTR